MAQSTESSIGEFLQRYTPARKVRSPNLLDERYRLESSMPLPELDTKNARAYAASDLLLPERKLFVLVCHPGSIQRYSAVKTLEGVIHPNIMLLAASGVMLLAQPQEERFVLVYERPAGQKLSVLLAESKIQIGEYFLIKNIISPLASALRRFRELGLTHGSINPDNIYFDTVPILGDCLSEPCGFSQPFYFEPVERIQATAMGKGDGKIINDYYALTVLVLYILHGSQHFADMTPVPLIQAILKEGAYSVLSMGKPNPEIFNDFFRGLLSLNPRERWDEARVDFWLSGKRFNRLSTPVPAEALRPFEHGELIIDTRRELAQILYHQWSQIPELLKSGKIQHWVSFSVRDKDMADNIGRIARSVSRLNSNEEMHLNEQLMRLLILLDPVGPIRIGPLSFYPDSSDTLLTSLVAAKADKELQLLMHFIEFNLVDVWVYAQSKEEAVSKPLSAALLHLDRARGNMRTVGLGFGLERIIYELNPDMPCQSPLFTGYYVSGNQQTLQKLDRLAPQLSKSKDPIDRHIASYIGAKLNIQHAIRLADLADAPELASHPMVVALRLFSMANGKDEEMFPGLTHWLALRLVPAMSHIRSKSLREKLGAMLLTRAATGSLLKLSQMVIYSGYGTADLQGFESAKNAYAECSAKIALYRDPNYISRTSAKVGYAIAESIAYIGLMVSLFQVWKTML